MKTDREMTESLLRRRDQYMMKKAKRGLILRQIPKVALPLCAAAALVTVLSMNISRLASPGTESVDITLVSGNATLPDSTGNQTAKKNSDELLYRIDSVMESPYYDITCLKASELFLLNGDELKHAGISFADNVDIPREIVCGNVIYEYTDSYVSSEYLNGDITLTPFGEAAILCKMEQGEFDIQNVTVFYIDNLDDYAAIFINGQIEVYRADRSAQVSVVGSSEKEDYEYYQEILKMEDEIEDLKSNISGSYDNYLYWSIDTGNNYFIISDASDSENLLCRRFELTTLGGFSDDLSLETDQYGNVTDDNEKILKYIKTIELNDWDYNIFNLNKMPDEMIVDTFEFRNNTFTFAGYLNTDSTQRLTQWGEYYNGGGHFTVFKTEQSNSFAVIMNDRIAIYCTEGGIAYDTSITPLNIDQMNEVIYSFRNGYDWNSDIENDRHYFYDGIFRVQFYYRGDSGIDYALLITSDDPSYSRVLSIELVNLNTYEIIDITNEENWTQRTEVTLVDNFAAYN